MDLAAAFLADAASSRERLLFVIGGGITRLYRETFPAPAGVALVLLVEMEQAELNVEHSLGIVMTTGDTKASETSGTFTIQSDEPGTAGDLPLYVPMVVAIPDLPSSGMYRLEVRVGEARRLIRFWAGPRGADAPTPQSSAAQAEGVPST